MSEPSNLLAISGLTVKFGGLTALEDVYLDVKPNSVVGLIGPNGAGKTTLFNSISGLVPPSAGEISYEDKKINWPKPNQLAELGIARTLQGVGLFSGLSVLENVMMGADTHNKSNFIRDILGFSPKFEKDLEERAHQALAWAGAAHTAFLEPTELTYPDSKRVAIARALVLNPKLLLLDEPAAGLGQDEIDQLAELIKQLKRRCAILIVEHHVDFVSDISDQVYVLNFGKVIASGDFNTVKRDPAVVAAYLGTTADGQEIGNRNA
ncbi:branched-chain amino acid ABC transporter ATPase [freshwater metagenome]|uniref:Branched-chain amino acid ABC transporter ATPase n=1 Tax=freshwater metagenome TaxID=449393 RepID=A0A094QHZ5_9ZZZZ